VVMAPGSQAAEMPRPSGQLATRQPRERGCTLRSGLIRARASAFLEGCSRLFLSEVVVGVDVARAMKLSRVTAHDDGLNVMDVQDREGAGLI
jgi:hypothetical protein